jgi:translation initiation factor 1
MSNKNKKKDGVVYSTNPDFTFNDKDEDPEHVPDNEQELRVWLETGNRKGKKATVVRGYRGAESDLREFAKVLKSHLGTGGSAKDGEIIIQGDHRDKVVAFALNRGMKAKKAGG